MKIIFSILLLLSISNATMFQTVSKDQVKLVQKGSSKNYCPNCGMNLTKFYKTNHIHNNHQYCSIHCLVEATKGEIPKDAKVVDAKKLIHIDAKTAYYVIGSKVKGTMTMNSKYAFANKQDALNFVKRNGGKISDFSQAYIIAKKDFKKDIKMISKKRVKKVYKKGKMLYTKKCQKNKINIDQFSNIAELKAYIKDNNICKVKKDKQLQVISVYLWDIKKLKKSIQNNKSINVPKKAKCPVCGMFVAKYPKWAAQIKLHKHNLYFDGVKDMMKWIFKNEKEINKIFVTDYYTTNKIQAKKAFYVIGSNVYGPMGNELIPFSTKEKAKEFKKNHEGKKIIKFNKITKELVKSL
jgi:nitrous oxide reductase accessory protein NosL